MKDLLNLVSQGVKEACERIEAAALVADKFEGERWGDQDDLSKGVVFSLRVLAEDAALSLRFIQHDIQRANEITLVEEVEEVPEEPAQEPVREAGILTEEEIDAFEAQYGLYAPAFGY